ncbi:MAG TPA: methylated-DNA--[protein]-cysteine S-methyltransferase [Thermomicrobiales bacterium]|nr:methylated-DNA--[protein]-cysteine S-methyltransferase [Thermomicrobiales bacterium]
MSQTSLIPTHLALAADDPSADPCDVAEAAMPDLVIGDLAPLDEAWVRRHTLTCSYCAGVLQDLEHVCTTLETCDSLLTEERSGFGPPSAARSLGLSDVRYGYMESPVGDILLGVSDLGVTEVSYLAENDLYDTLRELEGRGFLVYERQVAVAPVAEELRAYFQRQRDTFSTPVDLTGITDFTQRVLHSAQHIPYGKVWTYGDVARAIGQPRASRAVGNALGRNPIPVIIPCHRVILSSGAMGWYTGGPAIKRTLLGLEGVTWAHESQTALSLDQ